MVRWSAVGSVLRRPTSRQVNLLLEVLVVTALMTGVVSWLVPLSSARILTFTHAGAGVLILLVAPLKVRGSVRTGFRRRRPTRWLSAAFGGLVLTTVCLGLAHASGLWYGVGYWSALWTHQLIAFILVPLLVWHVVSRPVRPTTVDLDRRSVVTAGAAAAVAAGVVVVQEITLDLVELDGASRDGTGSHDTGSFDPDRMPVVQWINDRAPADTSSESWTLSIAGAPVTIDELRSKASPLTARLDCTGGWYADQRWDAVALSGLLPDDVTGRSVRVTSATGYRRLFPLADADSVFLAVGYDGRPLRRGHGAPVRIVAPNRRGPQWVKWVVDVAVSDRPSWLQLPLPPT